MGFAARVPIWARRMLGIIVPTTSFAVVGALLSLLWKGRVNWLILTSGMAISLDRLCFHGHGGSRSPSGQALLWAMGMQMLWLPYWTIIWKRPLSRKQRVVSFTGACVAVIILNLLVFSLIGVPSMML